MCVCRKGGGWILHLISRLQKSIVILEDKSPISLVRALDLLADPATVADRGLSLLGDQPTACGR